MRRKSKLDAMATYLAQARTAAVNADEFGYRDALEHLMGVVGSEVDAYGGVAPTMPFRKKIERREKTGRGGAG